MSQRPTSSLSTLVKDFVAVVAFSVLAQVVWAFIGTVVRLQTGIRTMQWALVGLWVGPACVAVLYLRARRRSWRESLLVGRPSDC